MRIVPPRPVALRLFALCGFALLGLGCDKRTLEVARPATPADTFTLTSDWPAFAQSASTKVDVLFMIDDSSSMASRQAQLLADFAEFTGVLGALPGGMPDLHLGVVSSSMGTGRNPSVQGCPTGGDRGVLHNARVGPTCAGVELTDRFIAVHADANTGQLVTNYGAVTLPDAFGCIAALGEVGCGFEHQLSSVRHALDPALAPSENAGFLRPDALLAVILVSDEDDCSAPSDSDVFDDTLSKFSDPLGPLRSYRCNEVGHVCLIDGKLQPPPSDMATDDLMGCRSAEDGRLDDVADFVAFLKHLKGDPARVFLAAFGGPPIPYSVGVAHSQADPTDPTPWPFVQHSCVAPDGSFADPAVRIAQAVEAFGGHGVFSSICATSFGPLLAVMATSLARPLAHACVARPAAGHGCTVIDRWLDDSGDGMAARLPSCAEAPMPLPCWRLLDDATCDAGAQQLVVDRGGAAVRPTLVTAIDCTTPHP